MYYNTQFLILFILLKKIVLLSLLNLLSNFKNLIFEYVAKFKKNLFFLRFTEINLL